MLTLNLTLSLIAASQGAFLSFLILFKKRLRHRAPLSLYFGAFSLIIFSWILIWGNVLINGKTIPLHIPLQFLLGPLIFIILSGRGFRDNRVEMIIPVIAIILMIPHWASVAVPIEVNWPTDEQHGVLFALYYLSLVSLVVYLVRIARKWRTKTRFLIISYGSFVIGMLAYEIASELGYMNPIVDYILVAIMFTSFYIAGYLFLVKSQSIKTDTDNRETRSAVILEKIKLFLDQNHSYLKQGYRIEELAVGIKEPVSQVSKSINACTRNNFKDFINGYRIEHSKALLAKSDLKIEAIALESGFTNKVSFISNFKKYVGTRPSDYRKTHLFGKGTSLD